MTPILDYYPDFGDSNKMNGDASPQEEKDVSPERGAPQEDDSHVDDILRALNPTGRYQILHIIVALLGLPSMAFQLFTNVFTGEVQVLLPTLNRI